MTNKKDLETHMKKRLGSTLKGASKEVMKAFNAGRFSIKPKQQANLFSLSVRTNLKQDIETGQITSIDQLDSIIDKALSTKTVPTSKIGSTFKSNFDTFDVTLPVLERVGHSGKTKAAATLGLGIVGWALASGSKTQNKVVKKVRVSTHEKGVQIHNAAPDGSNLKIEWDRINTAALLGKQINLSLIDGTLIKLNGTYNVSKDTVENITTTINKNACGKIEEGWD